MKLFIGCGSENVDEKYLKNSRELVQKIAAMEDVDLVFGAYDHGMMGIVYQEFLKNHKKITGITIEEYAQQLDELQLDDSIVAKTTMDRMRELYHHCDKILLLPGGLGTYTELLCSIEEHRTMMDDKEIILYNDGFFYTPLIEELYHLFERGFSSKNVSEFLHIESDQEEILKIIKKK